MAFIHVVNADVVLERLEKPGAGDPQDRFLAEPVIAVSTA